MKSNVINWEISSAAISLLHHNNERKNGENSTHSRHARKAMHQARHISRLRLFNEVDGRSKVHAQVLRPMISDGNLQILNSSRLLEHIRQRRHIEDISNVVFLYARRVLAVCGISKEKSRQNLDRFTAKWLKRVRSTRLTVRLG